MQQISRGISTYLLRRLGEATLPSADDVDVDAIVAQDAISTMTLLRSCVGDHFAMRVLRAELTDLRRNAQVTQLSDAAVVDRIVALIAHRELQLVGPLPPLRRHEGIPVDSAVAPSAPSPRSNTPASRVTPDTEPSFAPNLNAAALASTLTDAAKDGTPFCEECARAARAA